ncbi:MAG: SPOR domain-containing protein [Algoriphagus sp.]|nr:SPOR domain-containing protein [Algoriphagus sp.]
MATKTSENSQWTDPKDYGLPFVEITPLNPEPISKEKKKEPLKEEVIQKHEALKEEVHVQPELVAVESEPKLKPKTEKAPPIPVLTKEVPEKKSTNSWVWIVAILAIAIVGVIIFQIQKGSTSDVSENALETESSAVENNQNQVAEELKNTPAQEIQTPENQQIITDSTSIQIQPSQTPQTGTTIESKQSGTLVRIESKKERPQYFIVVGSLPSEALAVKDAAQYYDRAQTLYLILPYDDVNNYRLAIGAFGSFSSAAAELERAKGLYTEALWILKY